MNEWTQLSIKHANKPKYLDRLFKIYPLKPEGNREINKNRWKEVRKNFKDRDRILLLSNLLKFNLFPLKDSYVAYLKGDPAAIRRNPGTVARLCRRIYKLKLSGIYKNCSAPKETNRQIGPLFKRWLNKKTLGVRMLPLEQFLSTKENAILDGSDAELMQFAKTHLKYRRDKGLDFVARFNRKYIIGEAKFLTAFGGNQTGQFNDAIQILKASTVPNTIKIAILDGVLYMERHNKMCKFIRNPRHSRYNIMSSLVLRKFLHQV